MKQWKLWPTDECPRCYQPEDTQHVWVCKGQNSTEVWEKSLNNLRNWMVSVDTDPNLQHLLLLTPALDLGGIPPLTRQSPPWSCKD